MAWAWQPSGWWERLPNFHSLWPSAAKGIYIPERGLSHMFVPVVDKDQHPLMPTTPARARRWITRGKATPFWRGGIWCARLNAEPSGRKTQPLAVGIDPGSKREGYSVLSAAHTYLNIQAEARDGVTEAEKDSTRMRRTRRSRKTPCRKPRQNRHQGKKRLPPSTRARWEWKLRLVRFLCQDLSRECVRGGRHQGAYPGQKAVGSALFPARSG